MLPLSKLARINDLVERREGLIALAQNIGATEATEVRVMITYGSSVSDMFDKEAVLDLIRQQRMDVENLLGADGIDVHG